MYKVVEVRHGDVMGKKIAAILLKFILQSRNKSMISHARPPAQEKSMLPPLPCHAILD